MLQSNNSVNNTKQSSHVDEYIRLNELCEWLKVKPSTIHKYCAKKLMPTGKKPFGVLIWSKKSIQDWLDSQQGN